MRQMLIVAIMGMLVALSMSAGQAGPAAPDSMGSETQAAEPEQVAVSSLAELERPSGDSIAGESEAQTCRLVRFWTGSRCVGVQCCHESCESSPECD
jgi:hypothetical protein